MAISEQTLQPTRNSTTLVHWQDVNLLELLWLHGHDLCWTRPFNPLSLLMNFRSLLLMAVRAWGTSAGQPQTAQDLSTANPSLGQTCSSHACGHSQLKKGSVSTKQHSQLGSHHGGSSCHTARACGYVVGAADVHSWQQLRSALLSKSLVAPTAKMLVVVVLWTAAVILTKGIGTRAAKTFQRFGRLTPWMLLWKIAASDTDNIICKGDLQGICLLSYQ